MDTLWQTIIKERVSLLKFMAVMIVCSFIFYGLLVWLLKQEHPTTQDVFYVPIVISEKTGLLVKSDSLFMQLQKIDVKTDPPAVITQWYFVGIISKTDSIVLRELVVSENEKTWR